MKTLVLAFGIMLLLAGCIDFGGGQPVEEEQVTPEPEPKVITPSFTVISPDEGEVVNTELEYGNVDLVLSTSNLIIKR